VTKNSPTSFTARSGGRKIVVTRVFDAPREQVFKAYTDPGLIIRWWGPRRYTTTIDKMELRSGGAWRFVQYGFDGKEYAFKGVYRLIKPPQRIVRTFEFESTPGHISVETVTLRERTGKTTVTSTSVFQTVEDRNGMLRSGAEEGVRESMDRLAKLLEGKVNGRQKKEEKSG
jgi:uncharacterized protein YndB with AHSA1/START domain